MKYFLAIISTVMFMSAEIYAGSGIFMLSSGNPLISKTISLNQLNPAAKHMLKKHANKQGENAKIKGKLLPNAEEFAKRIKAKIAENPCITRPDISGRVNGIFIKDNSIFKEKANLTIKKSRN